MIVGVLMLVLVTGAAGFIGSFTCRYLLNQGAQVIGIDNLNSYYDPNLKKNRIEKIIGNHPLFELIIGDIEDEIFLERLSDKYNFDVIIHLAAQAGVRYSIKNPRAYAQSNLIGFSNILEVGRKLKIKHLIYASSSSVYGKNAKVPFSVKDQVDHPVSFYAATKKSNELMAHSYSCLFDLPTTGLRFFTVYGPWGRPDMAPMLFANAISKGEVIKVFNHGIMKRDFTYIDDIVEGIYRIISKPPVKNENWQGKENESWAPYRILNIGNGKPVDLMEFIHCIENSLTKKADLEMLGMQDGDVPITWADTTELEDLIQYKPRTNLKDGIEKFIKWFKEYE